MFSAVRCGAATDAAGVVNALLNATSPLARRTPPFSVYCVPAASGRVSVTMYSRGSNGERATSLTTAPVRTVWIS